MSRWFRVYDDLLDDPKVQCLAPEIFRALVNLWCIASKNKGRLPPTSQVAFSLRVKPERAAAIITELCMAGLIDEDAQGFAPHNWDSRQYKSDVSNDRVARFRERQRNATGNVTATPPATPPETESETETDTEKKDSRAVAKATRPRNAEGEKLFDEFWSAYPRRDGANPKAPAKKKFLALAAAGLAPALIGAAKRYAANMRGKGKENTEFVAQAATWLNQQRWGDYPEVADVPALPPGKFYAAVESPELDAWDRHFRDTRGRGIPRDKAGGWLVDSQWPPGHVLADGGKETTASAQQIELR